MHYRIANLTYRMVQRLRRERVFDALAKMEKSQWESSNDIKLRQWRGFKRVVEHAYANVPYYKRMYDEAGFKPNSLSGIDDLQRVPILTKEVLRENSHNLIAEDKTYKFSADSTSGSSGPTTIVYTDRTALAHQHAAVFRAYNWMGVKLGERLVRFWGTQLDAKRILKDKIKDTLLNRRTFSTHALDHESLKQYFELFVRFDPVSVYGFTSGIYEFARFIQENNLQLGKVRPKAVVVTGERLLPHQRELIESVLQCRVFNEYGCAEFGPIAYECPQGKLHINAENVLVEVDKNADADGDDRGNLVMTELNNLGMPMIRYRMGDVGVLSGEPCECGRGLPILEEISGRTLDFIQTGDGKKVHGMYFEYLPKYFIGEIRQFQIVQDELSSVTVRVLKDADFNESTLARFEEKLREVIGADVGIEFDIEASVFREATGKHRMVVSKINT